MATEEQPMHTWIQVCDDEGMRVLRFRVPGGWLYQAVDDPPTSPVFVPEPRP